MPSTAKLVTLVAAAAGATYVLATRRARPATIAVPTAALVGAPTVTAEVAGAPAPARPSATSASPAPAAAPAGPADAQAPEPVHTATTGTQATDPAPAAAASPAAGTDTGPEHDAFALPPDPSGVDIAVELLEERHP